MKRDGESLRRPIWIAPRCVSYLTWLGEPSMLLPLLGARLWTGRSLGIGLGAIKDARGVAQHSLALPQP